MDEPSAQDGASLEDQLRKMILGNVTISDGPANQQAPAQDHHQQRPRGRGRGSSFRGRGREGRNAPAQAGRGQQSSVSMAATHGNRGEQQQSFPRLGGAHVSPHTAADPSHTSPEGSRTKPMPSNRQRGPRPPRPPQAHSQTQQAGLPPTSQPPKILQRPHNITNADNQDGSSKAPASQYPPRQYAPARPQYMNQPMENILCQINYLDQLASQEVSKVEITLTELEEKETFRKHLEDICQKAFAENYSGDIATISLVGFGSLASGFATPGSDMDLAIVPEWKDPSRAQEIGIDRDIPRLLERAILDANMGARLLTRTRVPVLKVCQNPTEELYQALFKERSKWDGLPEEEKYPPPVAPPEPSPVPKPLVEVDGEKSPKLMHHPQNQGFGAQQGSEDVGSSKKSQSEMQETIGSIGADTSLKSATGKSKENDNGTGNRSENGVTKEQHHRNVKPWLREKIKGPLDFPKTGVGIQCDVNFENPLGIHNTHLLRCYSLCDPRVRPMVLFVKAWAKRRKINSSYSGTLSSYGWVLMVLHYLVNIAQPPVCPNLQLSWRPPVTTLDAESLAQMFKETMIAGYAVRFWRNEQEIVQAAQSGQLTRNQQSVGALLRGFFQYYASVPPGFMYGPRPPSFYWTNEVLSLRTPGGIRPKAEKGWTGAKTTYAGGKEVRNRYLFAIEDPFELDHNVARTVTHNGIVAIRDEFRRAWRILSAIGRNQQPEGNVFDEVIEEVPPPTPGKPEPELQKPMTMENVPADSDRSATADADERHNETKTHGNIEGTAG